MVNHLSHKFCNRAIVLSNSCLPICLQVFDQGYSRVPIYEKTRDNVVGLLLVKTLITVNMSDRKPIRSIISSLLTPRFCLKVTPLYTALNQFFIVKSECDVMWCNMVSSIPYIAHLFFVHDTYPNRGKVRSHVCCCYFTLCT